MAWRLRLTLGHDIYHLGADHDPDELQALLISAIRAGGAFIDLSSAKDGSVLVLISAGMSMKLERFPPEDLDNLASQVDRHEDHDQL